MMKFRFVSFSFLALVRFLDTDLTLSRQDSSDADLEFIVRQADHARVVLVGDEHQAVYRFVFFNPYRKSSAPKIPAQQMARRIKHLVKTPKEGRHSP